MKSLVSFPRYEGYKESGVDWLGQVPEQWSLLPVRAVLSFRNEKNDPVKTENILSLSIANGVTEYSEEGRGGNKRKDDLTAYKIARPNDIVLNSMNVIVGAVGVSKYFGAISPVYYALYAKDETSLIPYYERIFQDVGFQRGLLKLGKGILIKIGESGKMNTIRMKISQNDIKTLLFPKPDYKTQKLIATYLDQKTAQIDQAIDIKKKQIELLKERQQVMIQQAVTKGLDPSVKMKDSGVEWIGEVPEHWDVKKLKYLVRLNSHSLGENTPRGFKLTYVDIGGVNFDKGVFDFEEMTFKESPSRARRLVKKGDTVISTVRTYLKAIAFIDEKCKSFVFSTGFAVLEPGEQIFPKYLSYAVKSNFFTDQVSIESVGMSYPAINTSDLGDLFILLPTYEEQETIVYYLDQKNAQIEQGIALQNKQIKKLQQYKSSLINSVVTGKIKITPDMIAAEG